MSPLDMLDNARLFGSSDAVDTTAEHAIADPATFVYAGHAIFTLLNIDSGNRYTYRITQAKEPNGRGERPWFVGVLNGPDNGSDYAYVGTIFPNHMTAVRETAKSHRSFRGGPAVLGLEWLLRRLQAGVALPEKVQLYHEGRCCRCGRRLTTPESVSRGIGPECAGRM